MVKWTLAALLAALLLSGCSRNIDTKEAVRTGVMDYLNKKRESTGLDMTRMNIEISDVKFNKDEAVAVVSFLPKDSKAGGMSMNYQLERQGGKWVVKGRKESGANPHGGTTAVPGMPEGMGGGMPEGMGGGMPAGHPPMPAPDKK